MEEKTNFDFLGGDPPEPPSQTFLALATLVSIIYYDLWKKKQILIFWGGDPPKPPSQTFSALAILVSIIYYDSGKKKKFRFLATS
jgi:hypothetical protein